LIVFSLLNFNSQSFFFSRLFVVIYKYISVEREEGGRKGKGKEKEREREREREIL